MPEEIERESGSVLAAAASVIGKAYDVVLDGGSVESTFKHGLDELGHSLYPTAPHYPGFYGGPPSDGTGMWAENAASQPSPSEIAQVEQPQGSVYGESREVAPLPSPSEIANDPLPQQPEQEQGNVHGQEMGREM